MIWVTIVSLALELLLTAGLAVVSVQARDAASPAAASSQAQMALCQASNVARAQRVELWDDVIALVPEEAADGQPASNHCGLLHICGSCSRRGTARI